MENKKESFCLVITCGQQSLFQPPLKL